MGIWLGVCVLLREEGVEIGRDGVCLLCVAGVVLMCVFLRLWEVLVVLRAGLVYSQMSWVTGVSSSSVRTYFRCDRASISAWSWVCRKVGIRPWYMMERLMSSM